MAQTGTTPTQKGTPHPLKNQGNVYTPHPVKGVRKSVQPVTPFPYNNGLQKRSPFGRPQELQAITEAESESGSPKTATRPSRDGSLGASSSVRDAGGYAQGNDGCGHPKAGSNLPKVREDGRVNDNPLFGLGSEGNGGEQQPGARGRGRFGHGSRFGQESPSRADAFRTARSLDGTVGLLPTTERSAESLLEKSPYLAPLPLRSARTAGGGSTSRAARPDRLSLFAAYLAGQKGDRLEAPKRASGGREGRVRFREGEWDGDRTAASSTSPDRTPPEAQSVPDALGSNQNRSERSSNGVQLNGEKWTKGNVSSNGREAGRPPWVIGESRTGEQRGSRFPELKERRGGTASTSEGGRERARVGGGDWSWTKREERRRRHRVSREQVSRWRCLCRPEATK
jgi:hypothetical protein